MPSIFKELPNDKFTEKTLIALMLSDDQMGVSILSELKEEDFYKGNVENRVLYEAIKRVSDKGGQIGYPSVVAELVAMKQYDETMENYLYSLDDFAVPTTNPSYYIEILRNYTVIRSVFMSMQKSVDNFENVDVKNLGNYLTDTQARLNEAFSKRKIGGFQNVSDVGGNVTEQILTRDPKDADTLAGISSGFNKLDQLTNGFKKGELIYLAARTGVGKTAFALNICYNVAERYKRPVVIFEFEMTSESLFKRLLASRANVEGRTLDSGFLTKEQKVAVKNSSNDIRRLPIYIDSDRGSGVEDIVLKCKKLKNDLGDIALVMIDYIGLIGNPKFVNRNDDRQNIVSNFSRELKKLTLDLNIPILVLAQLNRNTDQRDSKMPQISDLRESGSLEQDADKVILLYRKEYYTEQGVTVGKRKAGEEENTNENEQKSDGRGQLVKVILAKNRNGAVGNIDLLFFPQFTKFVTPSKETEEELSKYSE